MNPLQLHCAKTNISETEAMNLLQDDGIVSDEAVSPADVALADCEKAVKYLRKLPDF